LRHFEQAFDFLSQAHWGRGFRHDAYLSLTTDRRRTVSTV
jgi:hypothetical protein